MPLFCQTFLFRLKDPLCGGHFLYRLIVHPGFPQQLAVVFGIDNAVKIALYEAHLGIGVDGGSVFVYTKIEARETLTPHFRGLTSRTGPRKGISLTFLFGAASLRSCWLD